MGSSYQTVLVAAELAEVRAGVAESGQPCVIVPVAAGRWAVVPEQRDGYAETDELARLVSRAASAVAASFVVFDSDVIVAVLYRGGRSYHDYLSDQAYLMEMWDDDDNEYLVDLLGRPYPPGAEPPTGAHGADADAFAPLGVAPVDRVALAAALAGPYAMAEEQHHAMLHALRVDPRPVQFTYRAALASGLGV
ncbi:hypothetical protein [Micromonospora auratinigra]|uniref:hypothetical protein n=1 Tax=Micromonospora auratinigra TaxID=261654 RepID=UPI000B89D151|nr:hypothetical protein [Micromonospora auratinigra]